MKETIRQLEEIASDHEKKAAGLRKHIEGLRELANGVPVKKTRRRRKKAVPEDVNEAV